MRTRIDGEVHLGQRSNTFIGKLFHFMLRARIQWSNCVHEKCGGSVYIYFKPCDTSRLNILSINKLYHLDLCLKCICTLNMQYFLVQITDNYDKRVLLKCKQIGLNIPLHCRFSGSLSMALFSFYITITITVSLMSSHFICYTAYFCLIVSENQPPSSFHSCVHGWLLQAL